MNELESQGFSLDNWSLDSHHYENSLMIKGRKKILILNVKEMLLLSDGTQPDQNADADSFW